MTKKIIIVLIVIIGVLLIAGAGFYYLKGYQLMNRTSSTAKEATTVPPHPAPVVLPTLDDVTKQNQINYPDTVTGIIHFLDKGTLIKSTITTSDGKVYTLSPNQPEVIYETFGAKNGSRVQVQGKISGDNLNFLNLKVLTPAK